MEAATAATSPSQPRHTKPKRKRAAAVSASELELEKLNSLPWNPSLPQHNDDEDPFAMLANGSSELEGGFLSLEEIDETDYGLVIPEPHKNEERRKQKKKSNRFQDLYL